MDTAVCFGGVGMKKQFTILMILLSSLIWAKDYALIVGNWNYSKVKGFSSFKKSTIEKDINNYEAVLISKQVTDIQILRNVTKAEIINALKYIEKKIKKNDRFYMFFTGHGLSPDNNKYIQALYTTKHKSKKLKYYMKNSGAIVPINLDKNNLSKTLIVGRIDLKPIFTKINKKVKNALIVFDACYSEKSSRRYKGKLNENLNKNILKDKKNNYPYNKIVYISSSVIEAEVGVFSTALKNCLLKTNRNKEVEKCLNSNSQIEAQIPTVFPKNKTVNLF